MSTLVRPVALGASHPWSGDAWRAAVAGAALATFAAALRGVGGSLMRVVGTGDAGGGITMDVEHDAEQRFIDEAYAWLRWMHERAEELVRGTDRRELDVLHALRRRAASLVDSGRPLCFGRIDLSSGEALHIGRRHVEDQRGDPVVVEGGRRSPWPSTGRARSRRWACGAAPVRARRAPHPVDGR